MDDEFLSRFRETPRTEFSKQLYERINQPMNTNIRARTALSRWSPALALASILLAAVLLFSFPPARAAAQDFLNLFRVKKFTAITVDPARLQQLQNSNLDFKSMLGSNVEVVKKSGEPKEVSSSAEAAQLAGFQVRAPKDLPNGLQLSATRVSDGETVRVTADVAKAQAVLDTLGIDDLKIPEKLNGANVTVSTSPGVVMQFSSGRQNVTLAQSRSPQIELPAGVDLAQLGEIALRAAGMSKTEAHNFAQTIDWHSTLLVPIPANAADFREVDVRGNKGLLVTTNGGAGLQMKGVPNARAQESILLWSQGDMVYALQGSIMSVDLLTIANSVQ